MESKLKCHFTILVFLGLLSLHAQTISLSSFSTGYSRPVDIQNAGDSRLFIVEQDGIISICDSLGTRKTTPFLNIDSRVTSSGNEQGLLGLAFHPDYKSNGFFYVYYTDNSGDCRLSRYSVTNNPDIADVNSEVILLTLDQPFSNHNGGCIQFGPDGYLYIGTGDGGSGGDPGNRAQNGLSLLGKMLRIDINGPGGSYVVPSSNPFVGNGSIADEIWAIGFRNPWRFSFDRITGDLWIGDVGQEDWEEIDFEPASTGGGLNYGWRCYEGDSTYNTTGCLPTEGYTFPAFVYQSNFPSGCSVTGGYRYRGGAFSSLYGMYIFADYCSGQFWKITGSPGNWSTGTLINSSNFEFSAFGEDQFGELYAAGLSSGTIYKITEATCSPTAVILEGETVEICPGEELHAVEGAGHSYQWYRDGNIIETATLSKYSPTVNGDYSVLVTNINGCMNTSSVSTLTLLPATLASTPAIEGPEYICSGEEVTYSISPISGATGYKWTYSSNGSFNGSDDDIQAILNASSSGELGVMAFNACDTVMDTLKLLVATELFITMDSLSMDYWPDTIKASNSISTSGIVDNFENFYFIAGDSIIFLPNFEVKSGGLMEAEIGPCPDSQGIMMKMMEPGANNPYYQKLYHRLTRIMH